MKNKKVLLKLGRSHRGRITRHKNRLLCKGPTLFCLICVLCHNFWTNYDLDLFSTSKWLSDLQFCERYKGCVEKMARNCHKMIEKTADSLLLSKHSIQFYALFLLLSGSNYCLNTQWWLFFKNSTHSTSNVWFKKKVTICSSNTLVRIVTVFSIRHHNSSPQEYANK